MAKVRVFNPSAYTPRSYFAAGRAGEKGVRQMAKRHYRKNPHHRRHNPFGLSANVFKDAAFNAGGALGSMFIAGAVGQSGWTNVAVTGASAVGMSFLGKFVGGVSASEELLKGGLTATIIAGLHQAGFASNLGLSGLGSYAPSWFGVPTASSQYLRAYNANMGAQYPRGQGTIYVATGNGGLLPATVVPGPNGTPTAVPALPGGAHALPPAGGSSASGGGMGYHRFRSRYAGNY
jgi:hypothetical protein